MSLKVHSSNVLGSLPANSASQNCIPSAIVSLDEIFNFSYPSSDDSKKNYPTVNCIFSADSQSGNYLTPLSLKPSQSLPCLAGQFDSTMTIASRKRSLTAMFGDNVTGITDVQLSPDKKVRVSVPLSLPLITREELSDRNYCVISAGTDSDSTQQAVNKLSSVLLNKGKNNLYFQYLASQSSFAVYYMKSTYFINMKLDILQVMDGNNNGDIVVEGFLQEGDRGLFYDLFHWIRDQLAIIDEELVPSSVVVHTTTVRCYLEALLSSFQHLTVTGKNIFPNVVGSPSGNYDFYSKNTSLLATWVGILSCDSSCGYEEKFNSLQIIYDLTVNRFDDKMMNLLVDADCVPVLVLALSSDLMSNGGNDLVRPVLPFMHQHSQFDDEEQRKQVFQKYLLLTLCNFANCSAALTSLLAVEASGDLGRWSFLSYLSSLSSTSLVRNKGKKSQVTGVDCFTFLQAIPIQENCRLLLSKLLRMKDRNTIQPVRHVVTFEEAFVADEVDDDYCLVSEAIRERQYSLSAVATEC
jgi:hypothetical protein